MGTIWIWCAALASVMTVATVAPPDAARRLGLRDQWRMPPLLMPVPGAPSPIIRAAVAAIVGSLAVAALGRASPLTLSIAVGLSIAGYCGMGRLPGSGPRRRQQRITAELPALCTLLAVCLEAGGPLRAAVKAIAECLAGPLGEVMRRLHAAVELGTPEADAWAALSGEPGLERLARELARNVGTGSALAPLLRGQAIEAQRAARAQAEVAARKVGVQSVLPLMVCFLPAFFLIGVVPIIGGALTEFLR